LSTLFCTAPDTNWRLLAVAFGRHPEARFVSTRLTGCAHGSLLLCLEGKATARVSGPFLFPVGETPTERLVSWCGKLSARAANFPGHFAGVA
jgi:hypothetical protein